VVGCVMTLLCEEDVTNEYVRFIPHSLTHSRESKNMSTFKNLQNMSNIGLCAAFLYKMLTEMPWPVCWPVMIF